MMLTQAQIHGAVRFLMSGVGFICATLGFTKLSLSPDQTNQLGALLEAFVGTVLPLASFAWNMYSHSASGLGKHFNQLKDN
jgi:hypothetical protein